MLATTSCSLRAQPARAESARPALVAASRPVVSAGKQLASTAAAVALSLSLLTAAPASARLEGVNNPQLLPPGPPVPVLDVAGFLGKNQVARLTKEVQLLEAETGVRLRVLAQAYPNTPGLAVRDYWAVDDDTVVFVADPVTGNILNFKCGACVFASGPWTHPCSQRGQEHRPEGPAQLLEPAGGEVRHQILLVRRVETQPPHPTADVSLSTGRTTARRRPSRRPSTPSMSACTSRPRRTHVRTQQAGKTVRRIRFSDRPLPRPLTAGANIAGP